MIKISGCADTVFEEAYFVLKPNIATNTMSERDIIAEANKIIREKTVFGEKGQKHLIRISVSAFFTLLCTSILGVIAAVVSFIVLL